jgi:hypothetical protein
MCQYKINNPTPPIPLRIPGRNLLILREKMAAGSRKGVEGGRIIKKIPGQVFPGTTPPQYQPCKAAGYNPVVQHLSAGFSTPTTCHFSNIYGPQGNGWLQPRKGPANTRTRKMKKMKARILAITSMCTVLLIALAIPAWADDSAPVIVQPPSTITAADSPSADPVVSILGIFGLRHDIHVRQAENRNLSQEINASRDAIHENWWDNIGIFKDILGNRESIRAGQQAELENRTANIGLRQEIHAARTDLKENPANRTVDLQQIAGDKDALRGNWQEINATHSEIHADRTLSRENWSAIHTNNQEDVALRQENNATREAIHTNHELIQEDRRQIRDERKNGSAGSS